MTAEEAKEYGMIDEVLERKIMSNVEKVNCSFCGKNKQDTNILIAGHSAHICGLCIQQAHEIVKEDLVSKNQLLMSLNCSSLKRSKLIWMTLLLAEMM